MPPLPFLCTLPLFFLREFLRGKSDGENEESEGESDGKKGDARKKGALQKPRLVLRHSLIELDEIGEEGLVSIDGAEREGLAWTHLPVQGKRKRFLGESVRGHEDGGFFGALCGSEVRRKTECLSFGVGDERERKAKRIFSLKRCREAFPFEDFPLAGGVEQGDRKYPPVLGLRSAEENIDTRESVAGGDERLCRSGSVESYLLALFERKPGVGKSPLPGEVREHDSGGCDDGNEKYFL